MRTTLGKILIDGEPHDPADATISVLDIALLRGYGCFEVFRSYHGVVFALHAHLDRLAASAEALRLPVPARNLLEEWVATTAAKAGDALIVLILTGGTNPSRPGTGSRTVVYAEALPPIPDSYRLLPVPAPWHSGGSTYQLTGVKALSYGPNLSATLEATAAGFDDALLVGRDDVVLEGPTYSVAWVTDGRVETPGLDLGILASITRDVAIEAMDAVGVEVVETRAPLDRLLAASEVFVMSTMREIVSVGAIGGASFDAGPVTASVQTAVQQRVAAETSV